MVHSFKRRTDDPVQKTNLQAGSTTTHEKSLLKGGEKNYTHP
jgi:hypothetical protein